MDAEQLRSTYNRYFSIGKNNWSSTDKKRTIKIAKRTMIWLGRLGFEKTSPEFLDVGCATGFYTEAFRLLGTNATGLDYSEVAVEKAKQLFPQCTFVQMNGFEPTFDKKFDIIFCRGFSGANTHDLNFMAQWINRYIALLNPNGFFVLAYSTNFSGKEQSGETVNHTREELERLSGMIDAKARGMFLFYYFGFVSKVKRMLQKLLNKKTKDYYYIFYQKN